MLTSILSWNFLYSSLTKAYLASLTGTLKRDCLVCSAIPKRVDRLVSALVAAFACVSNNLLIIAFLSVSSKPTYLSASLLVVKIDLLVLANKSSYSCNCSGDNSVVSTFNKSSWNKRLLKCANWSSLSSSRLVRFLIWLISVILSNRLAMLSIAAVFFKPSSLVIFWLETSLATNCLYCSGLFAMFHLAWLKRSRLIAFLEVKLVAPEINRDGIKPSTNVSNAEPQLSLLVSSTSKFCWEEYLSTK